MSLSPITPEPDSQQKQDAPDDKKTKELRGLRWRTTIGLGAAVLIGVVVAACHGGTVTASLAAFGASLGLGGVLGFLFGIPGNARPSANSAQAAIVTRPALGPGQAGQGAPTEVAAAVGGPPADSGDAGPANRVSNLEQVADWVTKLLLGGGLTQMQRIPPKVWQWSRMVALGILKENPTATEQIIVANQAFAAGLLVYGFILGFFAGFLITKLQLGNAISD